VAKNNKTRFFYVLYSDETWVFDQSECVQGPIYIIKSLYEHVVVKKVCKNSVSMSIKTMTSAIIFNYYSTEIVDAFVFVW